MWVQTTKECPVVVDIMGIILGVIGAIVAIGLMLILMWKVFTTIHDRREYARFEKEQRLAKWDAVSKKRSPEHQSWRENSNSICPLFLPFRERTRSSSQRRRRTRIPRTTGGRPSSQCKTGRLETTDHDRQIFSESPFSGDAL